MGADAGADSVLGAGVVFKMVLQVCCASFVLEQDEDVSGSVCYLVVVVRAAVEVACWLLVAVAGRLFS